MAPRKHPLPDIGDRFGRWTVVGSAFSRVYPRKRCDQKRWFVPCRCDCGNESAIKDQILYAGESQSCGCRWFDTKSNLQHGESGTRLHNIWSSMKSRCADKNDRRYGGRGIAVCTDWTNDYVVFAEWARANGYADHLQVDRINNDLGYSPENCRWVTPADNLRNKRNAVYVTAQGTTKRLTDWARDPACVVSYCTLYNRIQRGWSVERAMSVPARISVASPATQG